MNKTSFLKGYKEAAAMGFEDLRNLASEQQVRSGTGATADLPPTSPGAVKQWTQPQVPQAGRGGVPLRFGPGTYTPSSAPAQYPLQQQIRGSGAYRKNTQDAIRKLYAARQAREPSPKSEPLRKAELGARADVKALALSGGEDYSKLEQAASPEHQKMQARLRRSMLTKPRSSPMAIEKVRQAKRSGTQRKGRYEYVTKQTPYGNIRVRRPVA
jgi:hypothetical protein